MLFLIRFVAQLNSDVKGMFYQVVAPLIAFTTFVSVYDAGLLSLPVVRCWLLVATVIFTALFVHVIHFEWLKWCGRIEDYD